MFTFNNISKTNIFNHTNIYTIILPILPILSLKNMKENIDLQKETLRPNLRMNKKHLGRHTHKIIPWPQFMYAQNMPGPQFI